jgi:diaminopimelate decarboxylase
LSDPILRIDLARVRANADRFLAVTGEVFRGRKTRTFFAAKAHSSEVILRALAARGLGCEAIRCEEISWARSLGMPVIVSGFVKTEAIRCDAVSSAEYIVVENEFEIGRLNDLAARTGSYPPVLLRVMTRPGSKLGCTQEGIRRIASLDSHLDIHGLHFHAGWNITDNRVVSDALEQMLEARETLRKAGRSPQILNFGGSFCEHGSDPDQLRERMHLFAAAVGSRGEEAHFEPGRYLVGDAGRLTCRIEHVDMENRIIFLNTCAYGFRLSGATPKVYLPGASEADPSGIWTLYGFWPSESDRATEITVVGQPTPGAELVLENMGAYTTGLESQFALERPMNVAYV